MRGNREGGGSVFTENPKRGELPKWRGGGGVREGVCREFGGGAEYFFSGPKCPPSGK